MTQETHSDHGTVVRKDQAALVADPDGGVHVLMPSSEVLTGGARLIAAIALRLSDREWVEELLEFLDNAQTDVAND
jgi:hypothetical protein